MWLSPKQLEDLTGKKRPSAQMRELARSGIPFKVVAGRPIVVQDALYEEVSRRPRFTTPHVLERG